MRLTTRLLLLVLIALLPAVAIHGYTAFSLRQYQDTEVRKEAMLDAQLVRSELDQIFEGIRNLLTAVAEDPSIRTFDDNCVVYLAILQSKMPHLSSISVIDREGRAPCRQSELPEGLEFAGRHYFERALAGCPLLLLPVLRCTTRLPDAERVAEAVGHIRHERVVVACLVEGS